MRFLYPKYRRNRLTAQHAGGGYNDQSNYCYAGNSQRKEATMSCDICSQSVPQGSGYVLSSTEVTSEPEYWKFLFLHLPEVKQTMGAKGERLGSAILAYASHSSGWLVCDRCIKMFPKSSKKKVEWRQGKPFSPELGPAALKPASNAAKTGWKLAFGSAPELELDQADQALASTLLGYHQSSVDWKRTRKRWWQFWK